KLLQVYKWLGMSNLQLSYEELGPDKTKNASDTLKKLMNGYVEPRRKELGVVIEQIDKDHTLSKQAQAEIIDLLIPKYHAQDILDLGMNAIINPVGVNGPSV